MSDGRQADARVAAEAVAYQLVRAFKDAPEEKAGVAQGILTVRETRLSDAIRDALAHHAAEAVASERERIAAMLLDAASAALPSRAEVLRDAARYVRADIMDRIAEHVAEAVAREREVAIEAEELLMRAVRLRNGSTAGGLNDHWWRDVEEYLADRVLKSVGSSLAAIRARSEAQR